MAWDPEYYPVGSIVGHDLLTPDVKILADDGEEIDPDGRILSREKYPKLYEVIGTTFSQDGTEFRVPDLRERTSLVPPDHADSATIDSR